ncbi:protein-disulfide reductase DsbD [Methylophilus aquaticus]|uniref:Thiol:disulfide interchange protein DsbD n=1 Tax=Methylophilus aquaticus TaxID=1971610 RepID=A0ABT9JTQ6_9PROT|nr:protein-disulfide reductase DsbD [Methylophilus aquaticus]MDP8567904.1 protein-disulfide reductase DsbD [Methylophilus aquaticus]
MNRWIQRLVALTLLMVISTSSLADIGFSRLLVDDESQDFLPVEKAFQVMASLQDDTRAQVTFVVAPGHYLYRERIQVTVPEDEAGNIAALALPQGDEKNDPNFGKQQVFHHDTTATVTFTGAAPAVLQVRYQGCSEKGLCYPPQTAQLRLTADTGLAKSTLPPALPLADTTASDDELSSTLLRTGHWWQIVAGFFGAGLLLAFTPCVFPMIPILSGIIVGKNAHTSRTKALTLSLAYTLGMSLTYTLAGVAAGLSGQLLSNALQTPLALIGGALVFAVLSFSMFGFYELKLPSAVENMFFNWSNRFKGGHLFSDFLMGAISALIISPCVAAPLAGALLYISQTNDVALGAMALFSLSLGMGLPLLLIGASAGSVLPKAGAWMNTVRSLFGVLMLAVAVWVISPLLPVAVQLLLWAALCIVPAIYMRAIDPLPEAAATAQRVIKGLALMLLLYGVALLIGAWSGARSPLQPLQGLMAAQAGSVPALDFRRVRTVAELDAAIKAAQGKPVMLDFYADWCVSCKEYEQFVFNEPSVHQRLQHMVLLQADVTANSPNDVALLKRFQLFGPPGIIFFDGQGQQLTPIIKGYQPAGRFLESLKNLHTGGANA